MDKRTLLAVVISIGILLLYQIFFAPSPSVTPIDNNSTISSVDNAPKSITKEITITNKTSTPKHIETVTISNGYIDIFFNKQTGDITSASVVNYRDKKLPVITFKSIEHDYLQILNGLSDNYSMEIKESENEKVVIFKTYKENLGIIKSYTLNKDSYIVKVDVKISNNSDQTIKFDGNIKVGAGLGEGFEKSSYIFEG
ncbi:MAG: YidC/Oxa1 family insertase periplasmic-domain containing protein, partial [Deferribacterales bacterium]